MQLLPRLAAFASALWTSACIVPFEEEGEAPQTDGDFCSGDADCNTGICTTSRLCSHSHCTCDGDCDPAGEVDDECRPGWSCVGYEWILDPVTEFFGGEPNESDGYCTPTCAATCPEHYYCDGSYCSVDSGWVNPVVRVEWSGAVNGSTDTGLRALVERGQSVTLVATATSPIDVPIQSFDWTLVNGDTGERVTASGETVSLLVDTRYKRAELLVMDAEFHGVALDVIFDTCTGPGGACGYQGSGCCNGCDENTDVCL